MNRTAPNLGPLPFPSGERAVPILHLIRVTVRTCGAVLPIRFKAKFLKIAVSGGNFSDPVLRYEQIRQQEH